MDHNETVRQVQDPQLAARIADLKEARAVKLLALVLEQDGRIFDPTVLLWYSSRTGGSSIRLAGGSRRQG